MNKMELRADINYNHILSMIRKLPKSDIRKLANTLQTEIKSEEKSKSIQDLILQAPTWNESDNDAYKDARNHINNSRLS
jgi:ABC-type phosphate/phosphonate transport system substrate-binding protein